MESLTKLIQWYESNCDGDWEHSYGIKIETIDNPGWSVEINLIDTDLENKIFEDIKFEKSDSDWMHCKIKDSIFHGSGGVNNLVEILETFCAWANL